MIRMLMLGTALTAVLATGALAQDTSSSSQAADTSSSAMDASSSAMDTTSSAMDSSAMSSQMSEASSQESSMMSTDTSTTMSSRSPVDIGAGYTQVDTDRLASKIIGSPVYDSGAADANNLGKINDLVLDQNGQVAAVVLGVGGFLGIAEKQVAVDFSALQWTVAADNTERWVLQTTKDQLTAAPDFKTLDDKPGDTSAAPADGTASSSAMDQATSSSSAAM